MNSPFGLLTGVTDSVSKRCQKPIDAYQESIKIESRPTVLVKPVAIDKSIICIDLRPNMRRAVRRP
jgi:hypothetical protein